MKQKSERNTAKSVAVAVVVARRRHHLFFIVVVVFVSTVAVASFSATYYKIKLEFRNERTFAFARLNEQRCDITTSLAINSTSKSNNSIADSHTHTYIHTVKRTEAAAELCCCSINIIYHQQQRRCRCFVVFTLAHSRTHTHRQTLAHTLLHTCGTQRTTTTASFSLRNDPHFIFNCATVLARSLSL